MNLNLTENVHILIYSMYIRLKFWVECDKGRGLFQGQEWNFKETNEAKHIASISPVVGNLRNKNLL